MALTAMAPGHAEQTIHPFFNTLQSTFLAFEDVPGILTSPDGCQSADESPNSLSHPRKRQRTLSPRQQAQETRSVATPINGGHLAGETGSLNAAVEHQFKTTMTDHMGPHGPEKVSNQTALIQDVYSNPPLPSGAPDARDVRKPSESEARRPENVDAHSNATPPPKATLKIRANGKLAAPERRSSESRLKKTCNSDTFLASKDSGMTEVPKKVLKIRPDGKLVSPKATKTESSQPRTQTGRPRKIGKEKPHYLLTILYGVDQVLRQSVGLRIDNILAGNTRHEDLKCAGPKISDRPTHPFFLSKKHSRDTAMASTLSQSEQRVSENATMFSKISPRKARVISKPPTTTNTIKITDNIKTPLFVSDQAKITRFPGACDPIWPPKDMLHIGRGLLEMGRLRCPVSDQPSQDSRKFKNVPVHLHDDELVTRPYQALVNSVKDAQDLPGHFASRCFRRPTRHVMDRQGLQQALYSRLRRNLPDESANPGLPETKSESAPVDASSLLQGFHPGIIQAYTSLGISSAAFDRFECESRDWARKYSPNNVEVVLQPGREAIILRDWLQQLQVSSTTFKFDQSKPPRQVPSGRLSAKSRRKRRKSDDNLDGFIISSDNEMIMMDELTDTDENVYVNANGKRTMLRSGPAVRVSLNADTAGSAMLVSGPHGCGKTAAIYAAAQELGFEIFEINAGSRRGGKDVLDKVGDMTRNHLVKHQQDRDDNGREEIESDMDHLGSKFQADLDSGRQGTMKAFYQPTAKAKCKSDNTGLRKLPEKKGGTPKKESPKRKQDKDIAPKPHDQKQSMILLEEVDVLFDEDKMFWPTVMELIQNSRRPVVLTCSDESVLPLDELSLQGILRFRPPSPILATNYLLLTAGNEGHLLCPEAIAALYAAKGNDLRACLADLQFFCQMGIGDRKGGLEWMFLGEQVKKAANETKLPRVVSENTYHYGMGWLGGDYQKVPNCANYSQVAEFRSQIWERWGFTAATNDIDICQNALQAHDEGSTALGTTLTIMDQCLSALSAADILPAPAGRESDSMLLDLLQPKLTEPQRSEYLEGLPLISADPLVDMTGLSNLIALTLQAIAMTNASFVSKHTACMDQILHSIPFTIQHQYSTNETRGAIVKAIDSLTTSLGITSVAHLLAANSGDGIVHDVAPYVRNIVSFDDRLDKQRQQLAAVLAQTKRGTGQMRKTRSSLAALEGGDKGSTRRERWLSKETDTALVMKTGGTGWQTALIDEMEREIHQEVSEAHEIDEQDLDGL